MRTLLSCSVALLAVGCSSTSSDEPGKYEQSWGKSYSATTCGEWLNSMSPDQRTAAAADMLTGARNKGDGGVGLPPDSLVEEFSQDVDSSCATAASLAEAGATAYLDGRPYYRP